MVKNYDDMLSRFHLVQERNGRTDRQTDRRTDRFAISMSRVSMLTRDKKTIALNCLVVFRKSRFLHFGDRQTGKRTDEQMDSTDALSRSRCSERRFNKQRVFTQSPPLKFSS